MNFWTALFILVNIALCVRLLFFSDQHRRCSKWGYRLLLFLVAIYVGRQVIHVLFFPQEPVSPLTIFFHVILFLGALLMRPEYLPGNCSYASTKRAYRELGFSATRLWYRVWGAGLHGGETKARPRGH